MAWGDTAWGGGGWGTGSPLVSLPPGWTDVPGGPGEGATGTFTYLSIPGGGPWGRRAWGGYQPSTPYSGGGITVAPDPQAGVMRVWAWWPDAVALQLMRVTQDGTRTPVRGAYSLRILAATRRNLCPNPSFEASTAGWLALDANTTLALTGDYATAGTQALRMTSTTTTTGALIPGTLPGTASRYTLGLSLGLSAAVTSVTVTVAWLTATGSSAGTTTLTMTADQRSAAIGQAPRVVWGFQPPATAVTGSATLTVAGLPVGQHAVLDAVVVEQGTTSGDYYDGSTLGGWWSGPRDLSVSVLAPVQAVVDADCPLDEAVTYELYQPALFGSRMVAPPTTLVSVGHAWLTHPLRSMPIPVDLRQVPEVEYGIEQGVFWPLDATTATTVSGRRRAGVGTFGINVISREERAVLRDWLDDGQPLLVRVPDEWHEDSGWYSLGAVGASREGRKAWQDAWLFTAPFVTVGAPDPTLAA